jgi:hypothetical protein
MLPFGSPHLRAAHLQFENNFTETQNPFTNPYSHKYQDPNHIAEENVAYPSERRQSSQPPRPPRTDLTPPPSPLTRRRGPGRPSKAVSPSQAPIKRPTGHNAVKLRRQMHNDSAMRSRARLNQALEDLWRMVPTNERLAQPEIGEENREVCRAVKVEVAIGYLKKLQAQLIGSEV